MARMSQIPETVQNLKHKRVWGLGWNVSDWGIDDEYLLKGS